MNSFRIVVTLSHRSISFEYNLDGSASGLSPLGGAAWPQPLAFFPTGNGIIIGQDAVSARQNGREDVCADYFNDIKKGLRFTYGTEKAPLSNILLYAVEERLRRFFKEEMYGRVGGLEENRGTMPLIIAFNDDITENERIHVATLFRASGYNNLTTVRYNKFIARYFAQHIGYPRTLMAWSDGRDMHLSLFYKRDPETIHTATLPGLGEDPRVPKITEMIWESVQPQLWYPQFEKERNRIDDKARAFLRSNLPEYEGIVVMSDGTECDYFLKRETVNNLPQKESVRLLNELTRFLDTHGCADRSDTMLVLRGDTVGNDYFIQQFNHGFVRMIEVNDDLRRDVKQLLANGDLSFAAYPLPRIDHLPPEPVLQPEPVQPPVTARSGMPVRPEIEISEQPPTPVRREEPAPPAPPATPSFGGWNIGQKGFTPPSSPAGSEQPKERGIDETVLKTLKREWRETNVAARARAAAGKIDSAYFMLNTFRDKCEKAGAGDLLKEVQQATDDLRAAEEVEEARKRKERPSAQRRQGVFGGTTMAAAGIISHINRMSENSAPTPSQRLAQRPLPQPGAPRPLPEVPPRTAPRRPDPSDPAVELIRVGNLQDARQIYRKMGNTYKAQLIKDIIREEKSVQLRKNDLAQIQASRNHTQADRICGELAAYIKKCDEIGYACDDIKKLLSMYRRI